MSKSFSLQRLSNFIEDGLKGIGNIRQEVEEIQIGFNSAFVEWKAEHDATLERLAATVIDRWEAVGPDLQARVEERMVEERRIIAERRQALRDDLVPKTQSEADTALEEGKSLNQKLRQLNPRLDQREEKLKSQRATLERELVQLNQQIRDLSGCLGVVIHFPKINKLDRERQRVMGQLDVIQQDLKEVREEWQSRQHQFQVDQETLQSWWREATLKLAQLQGELEFLDDEASREDLARRRAVRHVIDHLQEAIACPLEDLKSELDSMVELNVQTDDYQAGLGSVGSLMSVLDGVSQGLTRFNESVEGLISEQKMHSAYLPKLSVDIPDGVLDFHAQWGDLRDKVRDDGHLCANPAEFVAFAQPVMEGALNEANIRAMFEGLGQALNRATQRWRG
jgi:chromosome segregation ATPase